MKSLTIIGASGHGKVVADIARCSGYTNIQFLDDNLECKNCGRYPVVGTSDIISQIEGEAIVAIGNAIVRERIQKQLETQAIQIATLIHPNAVIGECVSIGKGTVVMAGAVINPGTSIGKGCIINTTSSVDHDCYISNFVHISVGAHLAGTVSIGYRTWIGIGAIISNNIDIISDCIIGAGAVVVDNINFPGTYIGIPAKYSLNSSCLGGNK